MPRKASARTFEAEHRSRRRAITDVDILSDFAKYVGLAAETVICPYRVTPGQEAAFTDLVRRHWPTLHALGVVTDEPTRVLRSMQEPPTFVEIFTWADQGYVRAREHPEVLAIWEPMEQLCEVRNGRPALEFPHFQPVPLHA